MDNDHNFTCFVQLGQCNVKRCYENATFSFQSRLLNQSNPHMYNSGHKLPTIKRSFFLALVSWWGWRWQGWWVPAAVSLVTHEQRKSLLIEKETGTRSRSLRLSVINILRAYSHLVSAPNLTLKLAVTFGRIHIIRSKAPVPVSTPSSKFKWVLEWFKSVNAGVSTDARCEHGLTVSLSQQQISRKSEPIPENLTLGKVSYFSQLGFRLQVFLKNIFVIGNCGLLFFHQRL